MFLAQRFPFLIISLFVLSLSSCTRTIDCPDRQMNVDNSCVCQPKYFGESCEFEDECLTSFKDCNGYECEESNCLCPDERRGSGCENWDYSAVNGLIGSYTVENLKLDSNPFFIDISKLTFIPRNSLGGQFFKLDYTERDLDKSSYTGNYWDTANTVNNNITLYGTVGYQWLSNNYGFTLYCKRYSDINENETDRVPTLYFKGELRYFRVEQRANRGGPSYYGEGSEPISFTLIQEN